MRHRVIRSLQLLGIITLGFIAFGAQAPAADVHFTATTENVSGAGEPVKINLTNWSTDAERNTFVEAWSLTAPRPAAAAQGRGRGARGGAGSGRGGRGARGAGAAAPAAAVPADPDAPDADNPAFRFGRGGARGGPAADAGSGQTPEGSLAAAIKKAPTVGILWTSENVGYSIKDAYRLPQPDGGERIILATERRVGEWSNLWKPAPSAPATPDYKFSVIELHLNAKGEGEGKGPVSGKVMVDGQAKTIALDGYGALPVVFKGVKRQGS
jgi:hypothetical protein